MTIQYFDFGRYHGKQATQGSTHIRMVQMENYWPEFSRYKYGAKPDTLIFQKVYCTPDYQFPKHFEGIKILDVCDPDWFDDVLIVETCNAVQAVTCPTEPIAEFLSQFHNNVVVIPDRFDLAVIPKPKKHIAKAKTVAWFGYAHNSELLKPAMSLLDELDLNLILVSNDDPFPHRYSKRSDYKRWYKYVKYDEDNIYKELQKADFALLPEGYRPQDKFKSNNKSVKSNLAGLPVAKDEDEVRLYMEPKARQRWFHNNYAKIKEEYDIRKSVDEYKRIIAKIRG